MLTALADLAFGEMTFLKQAKPAETMKSASKTRSLESRKRDQKELENIEVFFPHKKHEGHEPGKTKRVRHKETPIREMRLTDNMSGPAPGSSRVRPSSRATTYISWSSSNHQPRVTERQALDSEQIEETTQKQASDQRPSCARDESMTPEAIRQKLIETGIYRCLTRPEPQSASTEDASHMVLHEKDNAGDEPPHRTEKTEPFDAPLSRAVIAQQAYIRPRFRAPQSPRKEQVLASTEVPTLPEPSLAEPVPVPERPPENYDLSLSQDLSPEPKSISKPLLRQHVRSPVLFPLWEDRSGTETMPYVQQQLPGSVMMHSPREIRTRRHRPQLPTGHFNNKYGVGDFRPRSSISSHFPLDARRGEVNTHSNVRSPHHLSLGRASTLGSASPYGEVTPHGRENAYSGTTRRQSMRDYIADLEDKTFDGLEMDSGGGGYGPLQPEVQVMHAAQMQVPALYPTGQHTLQQVAWEQDPAAHPAQEARSPLSPTNPYSIPGYEPVEYGQNEQLRVQHVARPPRPGIAMSGEMMDTAMYWKPNTYGL